MLKDLPWWAPREHPLAPAHVEVDTEAAVYQRIKYSVVHDGPVNGVHNLVTMQQSVGIGSFQPTLGQCRVRVGGSTFTQTQVFSSSLIGRIDKQQSALDKERPFEPNVI